MTAPPRKRRWWPIVAGVIVALCVVVAGLGVASVLWFRDKVVMRPGTSRADADAAFAAEKARFSDTRPILVIGDDRRPRFAENTEARTGGGAIESLRVLAWSPDDGHLATVTLPFWMLRLKSGSFHFGEYVPGSDESGLQIDAKDIERYGPGVVLETESPSGERVLITTH